jgi:hypothetical protein
MRSSVMGEKGQGASQAGKIKQKTVYANVLYFFTNLDSFPAIPPKNSVAEPM